MEMLGMQAGEQHRLSELAAQDKQHFIGCSEKKKSQKYTDRDEMSCGVIRCSKLGNR